TCEKQRTTLAEGFAGLGEEQLADRCQFLERRSAGEFLRLVAIGPFVVARRIDHRHLELLEPVTDARANRHSNSVVAHPCTRRASTILNEEDRRSRRGRRQEGLYSGLTDFSTVMRPQSTSCYSSRHA